MPLHRNIPPSENHVVYSIEYADEASRTSAVLTAADEGRMARQLSDNTYWIVHSTGTSTPATWIPAGVAPGTVVVPSTQIIAGAGLTGGGDLSADRTLNVTAHADGSIVVHADDIQVGVLASDSQHGTRGGGTQHAAVTTLANGFMLASDKVKLDGLPTSAVASARTLTAGAGLTGGGDLSADRTFNVGAAVDGSIVVTADAVGVGVLANDTQHGVRGGGTLHAIATTTTAGFLSSADKVKLDGIPTSAVPTSTQVLAGAGLTGGGTLAGDVTLNVTANADGSIVVHADDIQVGVLASDAQHGVRGGGTQHAAVTTAVNGFMLATDKVKLDGLPASAAPTTRALTAGAGLTGGGDLSADRTFNVVANADGSIVVNADDIQVGVLASDAQHGTRGGGTIHAAVTTSVNGFMLAADKIKLDGLPSSVPSTTRTLTAGAGLTGGGDLSADRTFNVVANADGSIVVNADDIQVGVLASDAQHGTRGGGTTHSAVTTLANGFMLAADKVKLDGLPASVPSTARTLTAGAGLTGGGDLSADRTFNVVANADGSIVVNADDIQVGVLASDAQHGTRGGGTIHAAVTTTVNGFMLASDKVKLDGVASGATNTPLSSTAPTQVSNTTAAVGTGTTAARADHVHSVSTGTPVDVGTANAAGSGAALALANHVHNLPFGAVQTALGTASGSVSVNSQKITNLADPTSAQDAATKNYVDTVAQGLDPKASCRVATTGAITLSGTQTIDGIALSVNDRVLVKDQATASQNGIYVVAAGAWTRATDADTSAKVTTGMWTFVEQGTVNGSNTWALITPMPITLGTTSLTFSQTSGTGQITAGAGLIKTGNVIDAVANVDGSIIVNANDIQVGVLASDAQHGTRGGGTLHAAATGTTAGFLSAADKSKLDGLPASAAPTTRILTAGAGLTGGGDLSADRTFNVVANADGSIVVNADDIQVGVLASDAQHGTRGGGTIHAAVTTTTNGFMLATDKVKLDGLPTSVPATSLTLTAGAGLTGGGDLSANRTFNVAANADGSIVVNADDIQVGVLASDAQHGTRGGGTLHAAVTTLANGFMLATDKVKLDGLPSSAVPTTRQVVAGAGLTGGGALTADVTLNVVANADGSIVVNADDIKVGVLATDAQHGTRGGGTVHAAVTTTVNGFMLATDKVKLDGIPASVPGTTRTLTAGAGLTGGGDLSADRTFNIGAHLDGSIVVNADDIQVGVLANDTQHGVRGNGNLHAAVTTTTNGFMLATDKTKLDGIPSSVPATTRTLTAGAGLTGGGDLSADRTFNVVANIDGSIVVNADDIQVGVLASDAQHGIRGNGNLHAVVTTTTNGFMIAADKSKLDGLPASAVPTSRQVIAGTGLTGGGTLTSDVTLNVIANIDGSIVVNANDIQVGVLASDAQHGTRGGGTLHTSVTSLSNGFMLATDKVKLDGIPASVPATTLTLTAGAGLTGGGDLSANRTFNVAANVDGSIVVNADDIQVGVLATDTQHGNRGGGSLHSAVTTTVNGFMLATDKVKLDGLPASAVPTTRQVIAGAGLTGGGALTADVTVNAVANADGSIVVNANDIQVGVLASDAQHGTLGGGALHAQATTLTDGFMSAADKIKLDGIPAGGGVATLLHTVFAQLTADTTTTSAAFVNVLSQNITVAANSFVLIHFTTSCSATAAGNASFRILVDGVAARGCQVETLAAGTAQAGAIVYKTAALTAGVHTIAVQWLRTAGTLRVRPVAAAATEHLSLLLQEVTV